MSLRRLINEVWKESFDNVGAEFKTFRDMLLLRIEVAMFLEEVDGSLVNIQKRWPSETLPEFRSGCHGAPANLKPPIVCASTATLQAAEAPCTEPPTNMSEEMGTSAKPSGMVEQRAYEILTTFVQRDKLTLAEKHRLRPTRSAFNRPRSDAENPVAMRCGHSQEMCWEHPFCVSETHLETSVAGKLAAVAHVVVSAVVIAESLVAVRKPYRALAGTLL